MSNMQSSNLVKEYMERLFAEGKRFDGRDPLEFRSIKITHDISNKAEGSVGIKLGKTEVVVGVKLGVDKPYPDSPEKGNLMCSAELFPMASPRFEAGPPGFKAIELGRLVDRALRESGLIDLDKLCIEKGEKVWTIYVDIYPLNDDGNLIDAATLAAVLALQDAKMPTLDKEGNIDYDKKKDHLPLKKDLFPISLSFFKLGNSVILDPVREEEEVAESRVTFSMVRSGNNLMLNSCQKIDPQVFTKDELESMMDILPKKYEELMKKTHQK